MRATRPPSRLQQVFAFSFHAWLSDARRQQLTNGLSSVMMKPGTIAILHFSSQRLIRNWQFPEYGLRRTDLIQLLTKYLYLIVLYYYSYYHYCSHYCHHYLIIGVTQAQESGTRNSDKFFEQMSCFPMQGFFW